MPRKSLLESAFVEVNAFEVNTPISKGVGVLAIVQRLHRSDSKAEVTELAGHVRRRIADHVQQEKLRPVKSDPLWFSWFDFARWTLNQVDWSGGQRFDDFRSAVDRFSRQAVVSKELGGMTLSSAATVKESPLDEVSRHHIKSLERELAKAHHAEREARLRAEHLEARLEIAEQNRQTSDKKSVGGEKGGRAGKGVRKTRSE